jgi:hypothetical protein
MPKEYKECVKSEVARGRSLDTAQRICAISYFKRHGMTPREAEKRGKASDDTEFSSEELSIFNVIETVGDAIEAFNEITFEESAVWTTAYVNDLPDSAFLYVESGGKKDSEGKTVPRSLRHLPYKSKEGTVDLPHLRNAIARIPQMKGISPDLKARLQAKARRLLSSRGGNPEKED